MRSPELTDDDIVIDDIVIDDIVIRYGDRDEIVGFTILHDQTIQQERCSRQYLQIGNLVNYFRQTLFPLLKDYKNARQSQC